MTELCPVNDRAVPIVIVHQLLDKVSQEIEQLPQCTDTENIVDQSFRGELISQVTCMACSNVSARYEPFLDLSLEFPRCFQYTSGQIKRNLCHLTEECSGNQKILRTNARKQLLISKPPVILRLHLKRFRWCGRNHREKINTYVAFDEELDISPFCFAEPMFPKYRLNAVIVHHGSGFRAGHYTAYTYNTCAGTWLHCNDARVQLVSLEDVLTSQAYILFYTQATATVSIDDMPTLMEKKTVPDTISCFSTIPDLDQDTIHTLRQVVPGKIEHTIDDEVTLSFHRDPGLIKQIASKSITCKKRKSSLKIKDGPPEKKFDSL
ncbi:Ubiquitin carboxyl-terminal hydrolase 44 [Bulinus truncatus]|nr:Ubiquitin carboxyl-terminal hydrolase 44 [Bulinus truncatus]